MKTWMHIVFFLFCMLFGHTLTGQIDASLYGDEWINPDQSYYKFYTEEDGIYRIAYKTLEEAGIPISQIRGSELSIFSFGVEIPLRTTTDEIFNSDDFIEFYASANDGSVDALLYRDPINQQLNPFISLYDNKRPYYLTWVEGASTSLRYKEVTDGLEANGFPPKEPYYMHREIITYDEFHHKPAHDGRNFIRYSSMDDGEGYGTKLEQNRTIQLPVDKLSPFGIDPRVVLKFGTNVFSKKWLVSTDFRNIKLAPQASYGIVDVDERFPLEELHEGNFNIHIGGLGAENEKHSLARIELHYPRKYEYDGEKKILFHQQASILSRYIEIEGFGGAHPILYNLTEQKFLYPAQEEGKLKFITDGAFQENLWMLVDQDDAINHISSLIEVSFKSPISEVNYLIISHTDLIQSQVIQEYADYRSSTEGGSYKTGIVDIVDLIERYGYGIKGHPIAIKNMMRYLKDQNELPDYTFIIGKGREYTEIKEGKTTNALVPTFGIPGSDNLFLAFDGQRHPQRAIGRLAAQSATDVLHYLEKIKTHENRTGEQQNKEDQAWKKGVVHLSGGSANNQAALFRFLGDMSNVITANKFGADVKTFRKTTADPLQRATTDQIISRINEGAAFAHIFWAFCRWHI